MNYKNLIETLLPILGKEVTEHLSGKLDNLLKGTGDEPWKKAILSLVLDAVKKHGADGVRIAMEAVERMLKGKAPKIDWADLEVASDILAQMQNIEAGRRSAVKDFLAEVGWALGIIGAALIKSLL